MRPSSTARMLAGVINQPPPEHPDGPTGACLPSAVRAPGGGYMSMALRTGAQVAFLTPTGSNT